MRSAMVSDSQGVPWRVALNLARLEAIFDATGVDVMTKEFGAFLKDGKGRGAYIAWLLCAPEAAAMGLNREAFLERFESATDSAELMAAAGKAFSDFFQSAAPATQPDAAVGGTGVTLMPLPQARA